MKDLYERYIKMLHELVKQTEKTEDLIKYMDYLFVIMVSIINYKLKKVKMGEVKDVLNKIEDENEGSYFLDSLVNRVKIYDDAYVVLQRSVYGKSHIEVYMDQLKYLGYVDRETYITLLYYIEKYFKHLNEEETWQGVDAKEIKNIVNYTTSFLLKLLDISNKNGKKKKK